MIIPAKSQFNWLGGFWQEDFKISANENTLWTLAAMLDFKSAPKKNLVEDHPMNISGKFGSILFSGFREDLNVKKKKKLTDGRLPMTKAHMPYGQVS